MRAGGWKVVPASAQPRPDHPYVAEIEAERRGWYELAALVRSLTPQECLVPGYYVDPDWTVRDLVAHLGPWLAEAEIQLERLNAGTYEGHEVDIDTLNAAFREALRDQPWNVAWTQANAGRTRMVQAWFALCEPTDEAAWWVHRSGPEHYLEHLDRLREVFRSSFFGRTGVQFWWGGFDFAVLLFTGRQLAAPDDRGYIMRYDLDAEQLNAGFWPGDDTVPEARFWAYIVPRPDGCEGAPIQPAPAAWIEEISEWLLPYEHVRVSDDPQRAILDFLNSVYQVAVTNGGWDAEAQRYLRPQPAPRA